MCLNTVRYASSGLSLLCINGTHRTVLVLLGFTIASCLIYLLLHLSFIPSLTLMAAYLSGSSCTSKHTHTHTHTHTHIYIYIYTRFLSFFLSFYLSSFSVYFLLFRSLCHSTVHPVGTQSTSSLSCPQNPNTLSQSSLRIYSLHYSLQYVNKANVFSFRYSF